MRRLLTAVRILFDSRVPLRLKLAMFFVAGAYLLFPVDLLPDILPVVGIIDDGGVIVTALVLFERFARKYIETLNPDAEAPENPARNNLS